MSNNRLRFDLTGKIFGKLTVKRRDLNSASGAIRWICNCTCGSLKTVRGSDLKLGKTKSCGCSQGQAAPDLVGKQFGLLTVISREGFIGIQSAWLCECSCGKTIRVRRNGLKQGQQSCGCAKIPKLPSIKGLRFGKWLIIDKPYRAKDKQNNTIWCSCKCDCGITKEIRYASLYSGESKSCGCGKLTTNIKGQTFGNVYVLSESYREIAPHKRKKSISTLVDCQCVCGARFTAKANALLSGRTKSCGCRREKINLTKPAVLYVLYTDKFIGYGITTDLSARMSAHKRNLRLAAVNIKRIKYFKTKKTYTARKLEAKIKRELASYMLNTGINSFATEALELKAARKLNTLLNSTNRVAYTLPIRS